MNKYKEGVEDTAWIAGSEANSTGLKRLEMQDRPIHISLLVILMEIDLSE